jgi:hypothetical protein
LAIDGVLLYLVFLGGWDPFGSAFGG